jgi:ribosomal RNA-processing protein 8
MFAVPGWVLSAPLKTQKDNGDLPSVINKDGTAITPPSSKKRKRKSGKGDGNQVTAENVSKLWEQHIEGKGPGGNLLSANREPLAKRKRTEKTENGGQADSYGKKNVRNDSYTTALTKSTLPGVSLPMDSSKPEHKEEKKVKKKKSKRQEGSGDVGFGEKTDLPEEDIKQHERLLTQERQKKEATNLTVRPTKAAPTLTPLQASMRAKLASARFRHLNQTLYTSPSTDALDLFNKNPEMYTEYHAGFRQQVEVWPENPVDGYISLIKARGKAKLNKKGEIKGHKGTENVAESEVKLLPRTQGACTIADLGCGDARLSQSLQTFLPKFQMKILSFDLQSESPLVKKADISALPLADGSVNVAVFCLALMGTNWTEFIDEAWRILHWKGELWVAEIKSRFARASKSKVVDHSVGKKKKKASQMSEAQRKKAEVEQKEVDDTLAVEVDGVENGKGETDVTPFVQVLKGRGFVLDGTEEEAVDLGNRMFVRMRFIKAVAPTKGKNLPTVAVGGKPMAASKTFRGKYVRKDPEAEDVDENAVLKPCVYKLR